MSQDETTTDTTKPARERTRRDYTIVVLENSTVGTSTPRASEIFRAGMKRRPNLTALMAMTEGGALAASEK